MNASNETNWADVLVAEKRMVMHADSGVVGIAVKHEWVSLGRDDRLGRSCCRSEPGRWLREAERGYWQLELDNGNKFIAAPDRPEAFITLMPVAAKFAVSLSEAMREVVLGLAHLAKASGVEQNIAKRLMVAELRRALNAVANS